MKKALKILGLVLLLLLISLTTYIYFTVPALPANTNSILKEVMASDIPNFVKGKSGYVNNGETRIWYESIEPTDSVKGTFLLFMGISNDAMGWPQTFLDKLTDDGYRVIRYDFRGTGQSDWVKNWKENPYSLSDLALDARLILDSLDIDKVELLGVSMGGMVAQEFAINFPERTNSLISIMSSGNIIDEDLPMISTKTIFKLVKASLKYGLLPGEKGKVKTHLAAREILKGNANYDHDLRLTAQQVLYNLRSRKGYNSDASAQHHEATYRSGSRYEALKRLKIPVLIIHGEDDPLISIEHSKKLADILPQAKTKWMANMGHDIPPYLERPICKEIFRFLDEKN